MALCAATLVNPPAGAPDVLPTLAESGFGVMQLPATDYPDDVVEGWLRHVAEQVEELHRHGYAFVLLSVPGARDGGVHRDALRRELEALGVPLPPEHGVAAAELDALSAFLAAQRPAAAPAP